MHLILLTFGDANYFVNLIKQTQMFRRFQTVPYRFLA